MWEKCRKQSINSEVSKYILMVYTLQKELSNLSIESFLFYSIYLKSVCKLVYLILRIFTNIVKNGFCSTEEEEEEPGEKEGELRRGTGIGEGKGIEDVTEQIEHEEQIEGLRDEELGTQGEEPLNKPDPQTGFEMEDADFVGTYYIYIYIYIRGYREGRRRRRRRGRRTQEEDGESGRGFR